MDNLSRRRFLGQATALSAALMSGYQAQGLSLAPKIKIGAHLWVYASNYPPDWDCTPILDQVFADMRYAGIEGLELMHTNLRHDHAVDMIGSLVSKHNLPVIGASYGGDLWDRDKQEMVLEEVEMFLEKLYALQAKVFGISVGDAKHIKTEDELDVQADTLTKIRKMAKARNIVPNLHNHTYEVVNGMHDLKGTLKRIPDFPLGPDLNWLVRGGVDPVAFIEQYGKQITYLHLRDQYKDGTWSEAVGEGDMDFTAIGKALKNIGFSGGGTIELAFPKKFVPTRPLRDSWKMSRVFVQETLGW